MKGISEIFSSVIVLLITLALMGPILIYASQLQQSSQNAMVKSYGALLEASKVKLEVIELSNSTKSWYLYNLSPFPLLIESVVISGHSIPVGKVLGKYSLVNFANFTGINVTVSESETVYLIVNGTLIQA